jgi:hypothetical protein
MVRQNAAYQRPNRADAKRSGNGANRFIIKGVNVTRPKGNGDLAAIRRGIRQLSSDVSEMKTKLNQMDEQMMLLYEWALGEGAGSQGAKHPPSPLLSEDPPSHNGDAGGVSDTLGGLDISGLDLNQLMALAQNPIVQGIISRLRKTH